MSTNENQFSLTGVASIDRSASKSKFLAIFPYLLFCGVLLTQSTRADSLNTWTFQNNGLPWYLLEGIAYGNGLFVAVGGRYVTTSANGTNWAFPKPSTHTPTWGLMARTSSLAPRLTPSLLATADLWVLERSIRFSRMGYRSM